MSLKTKITPARLLIKYNGLVKELLDNSEECSWTLHEIVEYHDNWLHLENQIKTYCESVSTDPENLQIWQNTVSFCDTFEKIIDSKAHLSKVRIDISEESQEDLQDTLIKSFDEEFAETPDFFASMDDDDDDDDDE